MLGTLAAAPVVLAPEAGVLAGITGALIVLGVAFLATWASMKVYDLTLGALLRKVAEWIDKVPFVSIGERTVGAADEYIMSGFGFALDGLEGAMSRLFAGLTWVVRETGDAIVAFGADVHDAIYGLVHGEIPAQVSAGTRPLSTRVGQVDATARARAEAEARARARGIDRVHRDLTREALARQHGIDAIRTRLNSLVVPRIRTLEHGLADVVGYTRRNLARRLSRVEQLVLGGAIAAVALQTLTRYFPYWRCTNVRRFNRALCRFPVGALEDLLAIGIEAAVLANICQAVRIISSTAKAFEPELRGLVAVTGAALECSDGDAPAPLNVEAASLPAFAGRLPALPP